MNVFFYLNRTLIKAALISVIDADSVQTLAKRLAVKLGEEEEWDEWEDEYKNDIVKLQKALMDAFTIPQLVELLSLP